MALGPPPPSQPRADTPSPHPSAHPRPSRRNFYIEVPELARMSEEEVAAFRRQLDGVKVRGKNVPKPVKNWNQVRPGWVG